MGSSSSASMPAPRHFVGLWTNERGVTLIINPDGRIMYMKNGPSGSTMANTKGIYDSYGFRTSGSFASTRLEGIYHHRNGRSPVFVVNGDVLKRDKYASNAILSGGFGTITMPGSIDVPGLGVGVGVF